MIGGGQGIECCPSMRQFFLPVRIEIYLIQNKRSLWGEKGHRPCLPKIPIPVVLSRGLQWVWHIMCLHLSPINHEQIHRFDGQIPHWTGRLY